MRFGTAVVGIMVVGCASLGVRGREAASVDVGVPADTALRIARTQLQLRNYVVGTEGATTLVTQPRAVPSEVRTAATGRAARRWVIRVDTGRKLLGGSWVNVRGFLVPEGLTRAGDQGQMEPVTDANESLFGELETIARVIADASERKRKGQ